ncbi:MAG: glycosyltransferase family 4 protein [Candidatus Eisenbacteria sp.]|nr:glycosyltransferase family 4 protein [Candidatus Eisenbacteria bacterium]
MPRVLIVFNPFHPDPGVSARHYSEFAQALRDRGWDVSVLTANRSYRDSGVIFREEETWQGIKIYRTRSPALNIDRPLQRLAASVWMIARWFSKARRMKDVDVVVIGSNPAFAAALGPLLGTALPRAKFAHWCFDVYPDAIEAAGFSRVYRPVLDLLRRIMQASYGRYDLIADLGPRMRERLSSGNREVRRCSLMPWAFAETENLSAPDPAIRRDVFGDAELGILYSGTLGRAHCFENLLRLARCCRERDASIAFGFSCRDRREGELCQALRADDKNVRIVDFVPLEKLANRLNSADLHMMSLKPSWSGISVPSKFFGSLAVGKPVIYEGSADSDIARLILDRGIGIVLSDENIEEVAQRLIELSQDRVSLRAWQARVHEVYQEEFRRDLVMDKWGEELRALLPCIGGS